MSPQDQLKKFAQRIYLTIKNRYYDDIDGEDGQIYLRQVMDWTDMFLGELETTVGTDGQVVDWWFTRQNGYTLSSSATEGATSITLPSAIEHLITDEQRYVQILQDGSVVANFVVVNAKDITNRSDRVTEDMCATVGGSLVFSRALKDTEAGGTIIGDVSVKLPRFGYQLDENDNVTANNVKVLTTVKPQELLILGVAKNATLPDIVQGKLSPSYTQKYNDLLQGAIARSMASSKAAKAGRQGFGGVRGIY